MSTFHVTVLTLDAIETHPNADNLELAVVGGYRAVIPKGRYALGDAVIYIPADSIVPEETANQLHIAKYLTGSAKNRVRPVRLRGVLSEGIVVDASLMIGVSVGDHIEDALNITKYEQPVPIHMNGVVRAWPSWLSKYDVENIKHPAFQSVLHDGELVSITEKLHGTNLSVAWGPGLDDGEPAFVCSRGQALREDAANLYWMAARKHGLIEKLSVLREYCNVRHSISLHGEVLGCQDLRYGWTSGNPGYAAFDIRVDGQYLSPSQFFETCAAAEVQTVPLLYEGEFAYDMLNGLASGESTVASHLREGVVVKPVVERYDDAIGRVVLKYISEEYLCRGKGSEFH